MKHRYIYLLIGVVIILIGGGALLYFYGIPDTTGSSCISSEQCLTGTCGFLIPGNDMTYDRGDAVPFSGSFIDSLKRDSQNYIEGTCSGSDRIDRSSLGCWDDYEVVMEEPSVDLTQALVLFPGCF